VKTDGGRVARPGELVGAQALWMGRTVVPPGISSGDHRHGESETGIYVASGNPAFVFAALPGRSVPVERRTSKVVWAVTTRRSSR
jgi:hypothetical protein